LPQLLDRGVDAVLEIDDSVVGPQFLLEFVAAYHLAGVLQQELEHKQGLSLQANGLLAVAQLTRPQVQFEVTKAYTIWQRVSHDGGRERFAGVYYTSGTIPTFFPSV
jgi:hypothetical protein